jgi:imidazolonepropionase-like amidohydrolase
MRCSIATIILTALVHCTVVAQVPPPAGSDIALVGGRIYVSPTAPAVADGVVIVRNGKIAEVGPRRSVAVPASMPTVNCSGQIITAGFQNSHVHFAEDKWANAARQPAAKLNEQVAAMLVRYGFTTVVDTGSLLPNTLALGRRIEAGEVAGPKILTAGVPLYPPNGVPYYIKDWAPLDLLKLLPQPANAADAMAAVRQNLDGGADIVKLFTGSWVSKQAAMPMPVDVATAAVAEAHNHGKLVFTHPSDVAGLDVALRAQVDVLAHAVEDTRGFTPDHLRRMVAQKMALIPTLHLFREDYNIEAIRQEVHGFAQAGGQVLFGTDVGYLPDYDPTDEYAQLGRAGLTWQQILASLTTNPAARFSESARRGRVEKGMDADLVVLARDPSGDVRAFADVVAVVRAGRVIFQRP